MNNQAVVSGIAKVWTFAKALGVGEIFSNPAPLKVSEKFREAALDLGAGYESLYLVGMENGDYNIQLRDFSFFQFGISKDHHVRFAYYPNPFLGTARQAVSDVNDLREYVEEGVITIEEFLHRIADIRHSQHPPLTRYENAPDDYKELVHPCSHFHFGHHSENRWALQRVLSPLAFALIIFKHYYSEFWDQCGQIQIFGHICTPSDLLSREKVQCQLLPVELFSERDSRQLAFR